MANRKGPGSGWPSGDPEVLSLEPGELLEIPHATAKAALPRLLEGEL